MSAAKDQPEKRAAAGDRIAALSSRFSTSTPIEEVPRSSSPAPPPAPPPAPSPPVRARGRHTFYVDSALVAQLDQAYRQTAHALYPVQVNKSDFLEL